MTRDVATVEQALAVSIDFATEEATGRVLLSARRLLSVWGSPERNLWVRIDPATGRTVTKIRQATTWPHTGVGRKRKTVYDLTVLRPEVGNHKERFDKLCDAQRRGDELVALDGWLLIEEAA